MSTDYPTSTPTGYLGFANLPHQVNRKAVKKGYEFTLMVVGESGLGKSTLINCMFQKNIYVNRKIPTASELLKSTVKIESSMVEIEEKGVKLKLTVVDTPGYGDSLDSSKDSAPILTYINQQFEKYLDYERGVDRRGHAADSRVHCCFYFISPDNHGLKPVDIQFMKELHSKVNIVPIIARSDALSKNEKKVLKQRILSDINKHKIKIYSIPDCDPEEDDDFKEHIHQLKVSVPFAVCSSLDSHEVKGKRVLGRLYPWGLVEVENPEHSDLIKLKSMFVIHLQDLRETTQDHYENYRRMRLNGELGKFEYKDDVSVKSNDSDIDKDRLLKEKDNELKRLQEMVAQMERNMKLQSNISAGNGNMNVKKETELSEEEHLSQ